MNLAAATLLPLEMVPLGPNSMAIMGVIAVLAVVSLVIAAVLARKVLAAEQKKEAIASFTEQAQDAAYKEKDERDADEDKK